MILNNYDNSLPENRETSLSFECNRTPILTVRYFDPVLKSGDHLILSYYVNAFDDRYFRNNYLGDTYTTIFRLDEDSVPLDEVQEFKQTTFPGEQIIDLGEITSTGIHTLSVQTIESSGIASTVQYFKFLVEEPLFGTSVLDFNSINSFSSISEYQGKTYYGKATTFQYTPTLGIYKAMDYGTKAFALITNNATYSVSKIIEGGVLKGIEIVVNGGIYYELIKDRNKSFTVDISGTYYVTNDFIDENSVARNLLDYLDTPALQLPQSAVIAAAKNKVALTRLFEAAKAHGSDRFIMPQNFIIVIDYHSADGSTTSLERTNTNSQFRDNRCNINIPNNFILDFNGCSLKCLQSVDISDGRLLKLDNNYNTHISNLIISGNYKNYDIAASKTHGAGNTSEGLGVISMSSCYFCSFTNVESSFSCGYDLNVGDDIPNQLDSTNNNLFNSPGYIDYEGAVHSVPIPDVTDGDKKMQYWYSNLATPWPLLIKNPNDQLTSYYSNVGINHFRIGMTSVWGSYNTSVRKGQCNFGFVHYYDRNNKFLKTVKFQYNEILIPPKDAIYIKLSAKGTKEPNLTDSLFKSDATPNIRQMSHKSSFGNKIINCTLHDTRSCICGYAGNQFLNSGTRAWNIAQEESMPDPMNSSTIDQGWHITSILIDIENMSMFFANVCLRDFESIYSKSKTVQVKYSQKPFYTELRNISLALKDTDRGCVKWVCACSISKGTNTGDDIQAVEESFIQAEGCYFTSVNANGKGVSSFPNRNGLYFKDSTIDYYKDGIIVNNSNIK